MDNDPIRRATPTATIGIVGAGRMGRAYTERLRDRCHMVQLVDHPAPRCEDLTACELIVLALRTGTDCKQALSAMSFGPGAVVVDLTTQEPKQCAVTQKRAQEKGLQYFAGGILGGAAQVLAGAAVLLLGPAPPDRASDILGSFGRVVCFDTPAKACNGKLLHNLALLIQNHSLALCIGLARRAGVENIEGILDLGTAGRIPSQSSVVRDYRNHPSTSYTSTLVAKDLRLLREHFDDLRTNRFFNLAAMEDLHRRAGDALYTVTALNGV